MPVILKYLIIYVLSGVKIIFGPTLGAAYGFGVLETSLLSLAGMMTTIYLLSYFGLEIRNITLKIFGPRKPRKKFSPKNRRFVRIWNKWGVPGIAFLTPLFLSPIGGGLLVNALGGKRSEILKWMWIFGSFWAFALTLIMRYANWILTDFGVL